MRAPTKILKPPYRDMRRKRMAVFIETDAGVMTVYEAAIAVGVSPSCLYHRLIKNPEYWRKDDIFSWDMERSNRKKILPKKCKKPKEVKKSTQVFFEEISSISYLNLPGHKLGRRRRLDDPVFRQGSWENKNLDR
jgi:hypothetical protein